MSDIKRDLESLVKDLRVFIELSFQEGEISLRDWINEIFSNIEGTCWNQKNCNKKDCPAYENFDCGRCWLIAGTMCGEKPTGTFVEKYNSCLECEVFKDVIRDNKVQELKELIIILVNSLRLKQTALRKAQAEIKILSGFLPICASCKNIRDDKGYWKQIESYIKEHSEAEFSHSICPECYEKLYSKYSNK